MVTKSSFAPTRAALAAALGVSPVTMRLWAARGAPKKTKEGFCVEATLAWRQANVGPAPVRREARGTDRQRLEKAQADEREAKAELAAIKLRLEQGELRPLAEIEEWDRGRIAVVRRGLLGLSRSLAPVLVGVDPVAAKAVMVAVHQRCRQLLTSYAKI